MPSPPPCLGQFEVGDTICNGEPDGADADARAPCAWRNRCAGLQIHCAQNSYSADEVVGTLDYGALVTVCEAIVESHSIRQGIPASADGDEEDAPEEKPVEAQPEAQPEASEAKSADKGNSPPKPLAKTERRLVSPNRKTERKVAKPKAKLEDEMLALHQHFETLMRDHFPTRNFGNGRQVLVKPGTFYMLDRTKGSHYIAWYCTAARGRDIALACVRFKPRLGCVHIELPLPIEELKGFLGAAALKRLSPKSYADGQFQTMCTYLDHEGIGLAVETIKKLVEADLIALPE